MSTKFKNDKPVLPTCSHGAGIPKKPIRLFIECACGKVLRPRSKYSMEQEAGDDEQSRINRKLDASDSIKPKNYTKKEREYLSNKSIATSTVNKSKKEDLE